MDTIIYIRDVQHPRIGGVNDEVIATGLDSQEYSQAGTHVEGLILRSHAALKKLPFMRERSRMWENKHRASHIGNKH